MEEISFFPHLLICLYQMDSLILLTHLMSYDPLLYDRLFNLIFHSYSMSCGHTEFLYLQLFSSQDFRRPILPNSHTLLKGFLQKKVPPD